jgi:hypothetical protein
MNHVINHISYGSLVDQHELLDSDFAKVDGGSHTMFNMFKKNGKVNEDLKTRPEHEIQDYFYFMKIIPHEFFDDIKERNWNSYSYSLAHNKKMMGDNDAPTIIMKVEYAPVKMQIQKSKREVGRFMINMSAIVGGVFVIFGLVNSIFAGFTR